MTEEQQRNICAHAILQAKADYIAGVPNAYERIQYWSAELERLRAADGESSTDGK